MASMSDSVAGCVSPSRSVADLPCARADVVAARAHVDFVVAEHGLERAVDHALVRGPQPAHRRIRDPRMIARIAKFERAEQAVRTGAARHAAQQGPGDASADIAESPRSGRGFRCAARARARHRRCARSRDRAARSSWPRDASRATRPADIHPSRRPRRIPRRRARHRRRPSRNSTCAGSRRAPGCARGARSSQATCTDPSARRRNRHSCW